MSKSTTKVLANANRALGKQTIPTKAFDEKTAKAGITASRKQKLPAAAVVPSARELAASPANKKLPKGSKACAQKKKCASPPGIDILKLPVDNPDRIWYEDTCAQY